MSDIITSKYLKESISIMLGKEIDSLNLDDIEKIEDISLKKINFNNEETDCVISDLKIFKNLITCTLFKFMIDGEANNEINKIKKLKFLHFDFCEFNLDKFEANENIEGICCNLCTNLAIDIFKNVKFSLLEIIGNDEQLEEIDITKLEKAENLKELSIHNYKVRNIDKILEIAPNIEILNLDGSIIIDNNQNIQNLSKMVNFSNNDKYYILDKL